MTITKTRSIPLGNYANGVYPFGPIATPNGLNAFKVSMGSCTTADPTIWPNASTVVALDLQFSYDNGATYTPAGGNGASFTGGIKVDTKTGLEIPEKAYSVRFNPDEPDHFKGTITVTGGPVRTYVDVTLDL